MENATVAVCSRLVNPEIAGATGSVVSAASRITTGTVVRAGSVKMPDLLKYSNNTANACHKRRS